MWEHLNEKFKKYPARMRVAQKMIELGLSLKDDGKIYCGNLKISDNALANAADVDRRVIKATTEVIENDPDLSNIFKNIIPAGTLLKNIAKNLNLGVIEIEVTSENEGILAAVTELISEKKVNIRQAYADDIETKEFPLLTIITESPVPSDIIKEFLSIKGVNRVSIYWKSFILAFSISLSSSSRTSKSSSHASKDSLAASSVNFSIAYPAWIRT